MMKNSDILYIYFMLGKRGVTMGVSGTDEVNLIDLDKLIREIGVVGEYKLWYICPGFNIVDGLRLLKTDRDVVRFINEHRDAVGAEFHVEAKDVEVEDCRYDSEVLKRLL